MLSASDFDVLEAVARGVRENPSPFGGVQVVLSGDFFQLPSVCKDAGGGGGASGKRYAFSSKAWRAVVGDRCMELTQVFRQADVAFVGILNELRWGRVSPGAVEALRARQGAAVAGTAAAAAAAAGTDGAVVATKLHTHRATVDAENRAELGRLPTPPVTHRASDTLAADAASQSLLDASVPAPRELTLKVGAQVLLLKTLDQAAGLVNGARGVVTRFVGAGKVSAGPSGGGVTPGTGASIRRCVAHSAHRRHPPLTPCASADPGGALRVRRGGGDPTRAVRRGGGRPRRRRAHAGESRGRRLENAAGNQLV
jgi:ATP-dependent DNA helicase PIF1